MTQAEPGFQNHQATRAPARTRGGKEGRPTGRVARTALDAGHAIAKALLVAAHEFAALGRRRRGGGTHGEHRQKGDQQTCRRDVRHGVLRRGLLRQAPPVSEAAIMRLKGVKRSPTCSASVRSARAGGLSRV